MGEVLNTTREIGNTMADASTEEREFEFNGFASLYRCRHRRGDWTNVTIKLRSDPHNPIEFGAPRAGGTIRFGGYAEAVEWLADNGYVETHWNWDQSRRTGAYPTYSRGGEDGDVTLRCPATGDWAYLRYRHEWDIDPRSSGLD